MSKVIVLVLIKLFMQETAGLYLPFYDFLRGETQNLPISQVNLGS